MSYKLNNYFWLWSKIMDKSFNDQELSDIMKEIEALEDGSEVLEELSELNESQAIPLRKEVKAVPTPMATSSGHTSMSFKVKGDMQIELQFEVGQKVVSLSVSEAGLSIEMDGGMTFTVPLKDKHAA